MKIITTVLALSFGFSSLALEPLFDSELGDVAGQGGVYLTGDITINANGGPLNVDGPSGWQRTCDEASTDSRCGARLAFNATTTGGYLVLDNIRGRFSFEGLTLATRTVDSGFDGDGAAFDSSVLEIGLPNTIEFDNVSFTIAASSEARPTDAGLVQTDVLNARLDGDVTMKGNLLMFPTGTP